MRCQLNLSLREEDGQVANQKGWILDSDAKAYFEEKEKQYEDWWK